MPTPLFSVTHDPRLPQQGDLLYVCFTHVPLPFAYPAYVTPLYLGAAQAPERANLRDIAADWEPYHPILGSLAGCFALRRHIVERKLNLRRIGVCQYRKFVSVRHLGGTPARNYPGMFVIGPRIVHDTKLAAALKPASDVLISQSVRLPHGYLDHYCNVHHGEDLLRFTSEALELGVLTRSDIAAFFNANALIPGGIEMGVYPAAFWIEAVSGIERVVRACIRRYPETRSGYQQRHWAFCAERLGSYLVLKYLWERYGNGAGVARCIGQLNLFDASENPVYIGAGDE